MLSGQISVLPETPTLSILLLRLPPGDRRAPCARGPAYQLPPCRHLRNPTLCLLLGAADTQSWQPGWHPGGETQLSHLRGDRPEVPACPSPTLPTGTTTLSNFPASETPKAPRVFLLSFMVNQPRPGDFISGIVCRTISVSPSPPCATPSLQQPGTRPRGPLWPPVHRMLCRLDASDPKTSSLTSWDAVQPRRLGHASHVTDGKLVLVCVRSGAGAGCPWDN